MSRKLIVAAAVAAAFTTLSAYAQCGGYPGPASAAGGLLALPDAVALVGSKYPGRVISAQVDNTQGDALHYHVDFALDNGNIARFDVNARTRVIANRVPAEPVPASTLSLLEAVNLVWAKVPGRVVSAEFDADPAPHYHVNVQGPAGQLNRYDLDVATQKITQHVARN